MLKNLPYKKILIAAAAMYLLFGAFMIWRSSMVAIDGHRYFSLFDDAMISMRYADNLAHGHGLVWNQMAPTERVEGFTNPLLVFIMSGTVALFGKAGGVLAIQLLGLVLLAATLYLVMRIAARLIPQGPLRDPALLFTFLLTVTFYPLMYWAIMGMETGLLTFLVFWSMLLLLEEKSTTFLHWQLAFILALCYLTRPDSAILILVIYLFRMLSREKSISSFARLAGEAIVTMAPIAAYQVFRSAYYGTIVPNTYTLKATGMALGMRIENGLLFSTQFVQQFGVLMLVAAVCLIVLASHRHQILRSRVATLFSHAQRFIILFFFLFISYLIYQIVVGGDAWPPYWRFIVPYLLLFFIALVTSATTVATLYRVKKWHFIVLFSVLLAVELLYGGKFYVYDLLIDRKPYQSHPNDYNINTAIALRELTTEKATTATYWAGTIPYYAERYAFDPLGKMDTYIANLPADVSGAVAWGGMISVPGHNKYDLNYTLKKMQPDFIGSIGSSCIWGRQNLKRWCDAHYRQVSYKGIELLLKEGSPNVLWDKLR